MAVCSTTALRKYLTQRSNLGQPLREKAVSTTRGHAEGETLMTSGAYRRPLFKSSQTIQDKGRLGWQKAVGYGRRSLGETAMFRYKAVIGRGLRARTLPAQKTEARVGCSVLNRMTRLGMPLSQRIA